MIALPPKLYLDTNHLINIARIRGGDSLGSSEKYRHDYIFIYKCIRDAACAIVFNFFSPLEWIEGEATEESALQLASIFDTAECIYQLEADVFIYLSEVLDECRRLNSKITLPLFSPWMYLQKDSQYTPAHTVIAKHIPDYHFGSPSGKTPVFPDHVPVLPIAEHVREVVQWQKQHLEVVQERINGHNETLLQDAEFAGDDFSHFTREQVVGWMKRFLQIDKVLKAISPDTDIDTLLPRVNLENCPATRLYMSIRENLVRRKYRPQRNDCDDFIYLPAVPYADFSLIERTLAGWILQTDSRWQQQVFHRPTDLADALARHLNLKRGET